MLLAIAPAFAGAAISSTSDDPAWTTDQNGVEAFAPDGDRAWVGGSFFAAAPRTGPGAAIDLSGNRIAGFAELTDAAGPVTVTAVTGDGAGGWFVAGNFKEAAGIARPGLVHLLSDGSVDTAFDATATPGQILALAFSGGTLYAGGTFTAIGGQARSRLAALSAVTGAATGWDPVVSAGGQINAISIQSGFAYVGGGFTSIGATGVSNAAKVQLGTVAVDADPAYAPNPDLQVSAVLATATDVYLGGQFGTAGGQTRKRIAKTDIVTGLADPTWDPNVTGFSVDSLATDGANLYAAGNFSIFGTQPRGGVAATPLTGTGVASAWYPGALTAGGAPTSIAVVGGLGGTVYIGGGFQVAFGAPRSGLAAAPADATGTLTGWDPETAGGVSALAADGSAVYAGGGMSGVGAVQRTSLFAMDLTTGGAMPFFNHTFSDTVHVVTVCGNTVYVGGVFGSVDGITRLDAAAFDRNTGALLNWDPAPDGDVWSIACGNGVVYLGGQFVTLAFGTPSAVTRNGLAAVDPVTGAVTSWDPAGTSAPTVYSLAVSGSTVYAGGQFNDLNNGLATRHNLAAIDAATGLVTPWDPDMSSTVFGLALGPSTIYAGGSFTTVTGGATTRNRIAELGLATAAPTAFNPNANGPVRAVARAPDGTIYMAGTFADIGGQTRNGAASATPAGTVTAWDPQLGAGATTVAAADDGRIYLGGSFAGLSLRGSHGLAIFSEPLAFSVQPAFMAPPVAGTPVSCEPAVANGSGPAPVTWQWLLDGSAVAGATSASYTPADADAGHDLSCRERAVNLISQVQSDSAPATVAARPVTASGPSSSADPTPAGPTATTPPFDIDGQSTPPPPVAGKTVVAEPAKGIVTVLLPGLKTYIPLPDAERIPVGTIIDARKGVVTLTTVGANGKLQSAIFYEGQFQVFQDKGKKPIVELRLFGGSFKSCPKAKRARTSAAAAAAIPKSKSVRHLWGSGKGLFRTQGRYASATIRGTTWLTDDRCDGTLVRVKQGAVTVQDLKKHKSLALKAPKSYLAHA